MHSIPRVLAGAATFAAGLAMLAGCSSSTNDSGTNPGGSDTPVVVASIPGGASTPAAVSTPVTESSASAPGAPSTPPPAGPPECTGAQLGITGHFDEGGSAAGHQRAILVFTNTSATTCTLFGYPGVDGIPPHPGPGVIQHFTRSLRGMLGGLPSGSDIKPTLELHHGTAVSAVVEASSVPDDTSGDCEPFQNLKVTAPDTTVTVTLPINTLPSCRPQVHPVVAGSSG